MAEKKVLMICPTFPPQSFVGGLRPAMFSKYLPDYGWQPIICTRVLPDDDVLKDSLMNIEGVPSGDDLIEVVYSTNEEKIAATKHSIASKINQFFCPDLSQPPGFVDKLCNQLHNQVKNRKIDVIWATSPHMGCLTIASILSKQFNTPWVADFRDIHEQDNADTFQLKLLHKRLLFRRKTIIKNASSVITISKHHAQILKKSYGRKVEIIPNGFDPEMLPKFSPKKSDKFSIVYYGRILSEWLRNPKPLFGAIDLLLEKNLIDKENIEILFYGTEPDLLNELKLNYYCRNIVKAKNRIEYSEVPRTMQNSTVLLVLTNKGRKGILTTKAFEYLGARRPVLCIPGDDGELDELLKKTNAGVSCNTIELAAQTIKTMYDEWKSSGVLINKSLESKIKYYSRKEQAKQLAIILNSVCSKYDQCN